MDAPICSDDEEAGIELLISVADLFLTNLALTLVLGFLYMDETDAILFFLMKKL
jgi:hypothetical protein